MAELRLEIRLDKIEENARCLVRRYGARGVQIAGVTKGVCGDVALAAAMIRGGITMLGDARLANLERMKQAGVKASYLLIRPPNSSLANRVVRVADISLNTEIETVRRLAHSARALERLHDVVLMVELGDLREGVMPSDLTSLAREVNALEGVRLKGIGANLTCLNGVWPDDAKMRVLGDLASKIEAELGVHLDIVSGGNSANHTWFEGAADLCRVNHMRLGELLLLGRESMSGKRVDGLQHDAFTLRAEVIEVKTKPAMPWGRRGQNAFGEPPKEGQEGLMRRAIVAVGRQDTEPRGMRPRGPFTVIGSCSDQLVLADPTCALAVGSSVVFDLDYAALMRAMTSPYVVRQYSPAAWRERGKARATSAHPVSGHVLPNRAH